MTCGLGCIVFVLLDIHVGGVGRFSAMYITVLTNIHFGVQAKEGNAD